MAKFFLYRMKKNWLDIKMPLYSINFKRDKDVKCDQVQQFYWCIIKNGDLYMENGNLPLCKESELAFEVKDHHILGEWDTRQVILVTPLCSEDDRLDFLPPIYNDSELALNGFVHARNALVLPYGLFLMVAKARQFAHMLSSQKFCSVCGSPTKLNDEEGSMQCIQCHTHFYPRISPCVIMAVKRGDRLLMGCHKRHEGNDMYTVLAGYVEIAESLEDCVAREVFEESGISVKDIKYFASQPWPFPSQLMVAFTAEYAGGEIQVDPEELVDAKWVSKDEMPDTIPPKGTIARALIESAFQLDD